MKKYDFDFKFKELDGSEAKGSPSAYIFLAGSLSNSFEGNAIKLYSIAKRIHDKKIISIDGSDKTLLKSFIETHKNMTIAAKSQLLDVLENGKEEKK